MAEPVVRDARYFAEKGFPFPELLDGEFFSKRRKGYEDCRDRQIPLGARNYLALLQSIKEIYEYNAQHAKSFVKRLKAGHNDWKNSEAIFSEIIVYDNYIRLAYEGLIRQIILIKDECDVIIERLDGTKAYLEVFCVMPDIDLTPKPGECKVVDIQTHTQKAASSIRQKLLQKIEKQGQLVKQRDNYALIDLNHHAIANSFTVLSSLSAGYKVTIDTKTGTALSEGYDWQGSIFNDDSTRHLKAIIYFSLGMYGDREIIANPNFVDKKSNTATSVAP